MLNRRSAAALLIAAAVAVGSCSGDAPTGAPPAPVVASIVVAPGADTIVTLGRTQLFTGSARDASNAIIPDVEFRWRSSDTLVARVDSLSGLMTAVGPGTATISAEVGAVSGDATVDIIQFVAGVTITPPSTDLITVVQQVALTAVARDSSNAIVEGVRFLWSSSNPGVATVDTLGVARSVSSGSVTISATGRGTPGYATVNVTQAANRLGVIAQPFLATAGVGFTPGVQIEIRDAFNARVPNASNAVTVALGTNPGGGTLSGTRTVNAINGIATFVGLSLDVAANYTITATSPGLTGATTSSFSVVAGPLARITGTFQTALEVDVATPGNTTILGWDAFGNPTALSNVAGALVFVPEQSELSVSMGSSSTPQASEMSFTGPIFDRPVRGARIRFTAGGPTSGIEVYSPAINATTTASGVAAGRDHVCLAGPTNVFCWGRGVNGQLGGPTEPTTRGFPSPVINGAGLSGLTAAANFSCGLTAGGVAHCWGGRFGDGQGAIWIYGAGPEIPFTSISAGQDWLCGLTSTGEVWCLGDSAYGLGDGITTSTAEFVKVADSGTPGHVYTSLDVGRNHACALTAAGEAWCWGQGTSGQLGDSAMVDRATPMLVSGSGAGARIFTKITAGDAHTCAIASTGTVWCWGEDNFGQLGGGTPQTPRIPQPITSGPSGLQNFTNIAAGTHHTCGVNESTVWCWGRNDDGQLGNGSFVHSAVQTRVPGLGIAHGFALGDGFTCVRSGPTVYCWGANGSLQLGQGASGPIVQPLPVRVIH